jgi:hypothetical protein
VTSEVRSDTSWPEAVPIRVLDFNHNRSDLVCGRGHYEQVNATSSSAKFQSVLGIAARADQVTQERGLNTMMELLPTDESVGR